LNLNEKVVSTPDLIVFEYVILWPERFIPNDDDLSVHRPRSLRALLHDRKLNPSLRQQPVELNHPVNEHPQVGKAPTRIVARLEKVKLRREALIHLPASPAKMDKGDSNISISDKLAVGSLKL
jgi:hypothetical protein